MACVIPVYGEGTGSFKSLESLSKVYTRHLMVKNVMTRKLNLVHNYKIGEWVAHAMSGHTGKLSRAWYWSI